MKLARVASAGLLAAALIVGMGNPGRAADSVVSSRKALTQQVKELNVDAQALDRVLNFLRDTSGANIVVNWKVLEGIGVQKDSTITMQVRDLPLRKVMQL